MSSYDPYDAPPRERTSQGYYREERREPRYADPRDNYLGVSHDLVPRHREDSDLSVEEIRRDFPPPGYSNRDIRRARSAGGPYYDDGYDDRRSHHGRDYYDEPRSRGHHDSYYEEEKKKKARVITKQEQIIAAITGAAIAIGGKELYDRRDAKEHETEIQRNVLASAALGAAGALAGYSGTEFYNKHKEKEEKKRDPYAHRGRGDDSDDESGSEKKSGKNFLEAALAAAGLGGAVKALTGKDDKSDTKSRAGGSRSSSGSRAKGGKGEGAKKIQQAAMASLIAGATEAFRVSKEPGGWKGEKAKRILTAAAGAATIDAAQKGDKGGSKLGLAESVIGGLVGNRVIHGSKKNIEEDEKTGRSRSRSRARSKSDGGSGGVSGLAALATAGLGAFGAKKIMDNRERSKSRGRDSDDGSPDRRRRSRSRSVVDKARSGLARLGIGNGPAEESDDDDRDRHTKSSRRRRDSYDDYDRDRDRDRDHRRRDDDDYDDRSHHGRDRDRKERGTVARRGSASSTDLGDSDEDERRAKKMRGKQILTTGLASVATIHAAASVYQSMEKRKKRQKAVKEGRLSPEEAKKLKSKAILQDAASVGIAALGIKSAIAEMKEAHELRQEVREWNEEKEMRKERRRDKLRRKLSQKLRGSSSSSSSSDEGGGRRRASSEYGYGRRRADNYYSVAPPKADRYNDGPRYTDGNPYAALPPPSGSSDRR
ncbi:hypothetical protein B0T14DRAFT_416869 [Immersiella caudata]|uniref:Uncharacterized protein n=1 Tax=Immersiella caudata TaxID=314043 RepID=A0AA40CDF5_9PEZI|nr:hypothetical protein B0T14DRAFT_416869 [Immersiella caudata]